MGVTTDHSVQLVFILLVGSQNYSYILYMLQFLKTTYIRTAIMYDSSLVTNYWIKCIYLDPLLFLQKTVQELIDKRKKLLKYLRQYDYKKFEWLLEKLNIEYKGNPE